MKKHTLEDVAKAGRELGETMKKVDDYFKDQEKRKKRPWWKKLFIWE